MVEEREKERIKCQVDGCEEPVRWIIVSPASYYDGKPDEKDVLQKPLGFCNTEHLVYWFRNKYYEWFSRQRVRRNKKNEKGKN